MSEFHARGEGAGSRAVAALRIGAVLIMLGAAGCGGADHQTGAGPRQPAGQAAPPDAFDRAGIVLDGDIAEWPTNLNVVADSVYLYFRVKIEGENDTLQAMRRPLLARFDLDGNPDTGARYARPASASDMGVDLEIVFSPRDERAERGFGVAASAVGADGSLRPIPTADLDLRFAPSYASEWYEARLALAALTDAKLPGRPGDLGRQVFVLGDGAGGVAGASEPARFRWPSAVRRPGRVDVEPPAKAPGAIRIMTWNVAGAAADNPEPFARIIGALAPDILLLQEWDSSPAEIGAWLAAHVIDDGAWSVVRSAGPGVAVVSRSEVRQALPARLELPESGRPIRFASAVVETLAGPVLVGSAHLTCCGYAGSEEDRARLLEAMAINDAVRVAVAEAQPAAVVIGGDLNLVGTRTPLDALADGLDVDGSSLETVNAFALGDQVHATWSSPGSIFTPGRLDYVLYSGAGAEVEQAFVLDTRLLGEGALEALGLHADDAHASDHRPVLVDLRLAP
jgi:endonuclease/exonuclease/phosphatase family metal-dependent hydrolase